MCFVVGVFATIAWGIIQLITTSYYCLIKLLNIHTALLKIIEIAVAREYYSLLILPGSIMQQSPVIIN